MSTTPLTDVDTELQEILTKLENDVARDIQLRMTQHRSGKAPKQSHYEAQTAIKALIGTIAEQIIGEDVECDGTCDDGIHEAQQRVIDGQRHRFRKLLSTPAPKDGSATPEAPERLKDYMENKSND